MVLHVGRVGILVDLNEAAGREKTRGGWAATEQEIEQAGIGRPQRLAIFVIGVVAGAFAYGAKIEMVLEIGSDGGRIEYRRDAKRFEMIGGPDARQHQKP